MQGRAGKPALLRLGWVVGWAWGYARCMVTRAKGGPRREVRLAGLEDLLEQADLIERAEREGRARPLRTWSPGQNLQHVARFMACSIDGFPPVPWWMPAAGRVVRLVMGRRFLERPPPEGFRLPPGTAFLPDDSVTASEGASALRDVVDRVRGGASFLGSSPVLGRLSRDEWIELHLRHAELHLGFVGIDAGWEGAPADGGAGGEV